MRGRDKPIACAVVAVLCIAAPVFAQAPADPPKVWTVTASAGLALTSGNSDTSTVKNKPPLPTIQQNDVAVLMAIVYKI